MVDFLLKNMLRTNIVSYQMLAQKAVKNDESNQTGVEAALERFFHKLEFLLKYGSLPTKEDTKGEHLPPELCGLRAFLSTENKKGSYVLQKDTTTQYRFNYSQWKEGWIEVIEEKRDISRNTPLYANYVDIATWKSSCVQTCEITELLYVLNKSAFPQEHQFSNGFQTKTYESFAEDVDKEITTTQQNILLHRPPFPSFKVTNTTSVNELTEAFKNAKRSVEKKSFDYLLSGKIHSKQLDATAFFRTCVKDLLRYTTNNYTINGVKIRKETLTQIMEAIVPDKQACSTIVNTTPLNKRNSYSQIEENLKLQYNEADAAKISAILQKPQFPLALLALVSQAIPMLPAAALVNEAKFATNVLSFTKLRENSTIIPNIFNEFKANARKFDIRMDEEGNLRCGVESFYPYIEPTGEIGLSKAYSCFSVPQDFVGDASLNNSFSIAYKLDELIPQIETGVVL